jgi:hypothetical protein
MQRRHFLKALGAISAGIALRAVPVLGTAHSVLEAPAIYPAVAPGFAGLVDRTFEQEIRSTGSTIFIPELWAHETNRASRPRWTVRQRRASRGFSPG